MRTLDLSENELAKLHVRHLVGGRAPLADQELLYRFEFPERPGALLKFLSSMRSDWNISLFHYRNQGDFGRVLVGLEVPKSEMAEFRRFLAALGYPWVEETGTPSTGCSSLRPYGTTGLDRRIGVVAETRKVAEPPSFRGLTPCGARATYEGGRS